MATGALAPTSSWAAPTRPRHPDTAPSARARPVRRRTSNHCPRPLPIDGRARCRPRAPPPKPPPSASAASTGPRAQPERPCGSRPAGAALDTSSSLPCSARRVRPLRPMGGHRATPRPLRRACINTAGTVRVEGLTGACRLARHGAGSTGGTRRGRRGRGGERARPTDGSAARGEDEELVGKRQHLLTRCTEAAVGVRVGASASIREARSRSS
jgi:hypothetical protein